MTLALLPESIVDKRIGQVEYYNNGSDTRLKCACIASSKIVGSYSAATAQIAKEAKRSVSTVQNWAHAHWLYLELRRNRTDTRRARQLWRSLPASHWWQAYDIQNNGYDALYYLYMAAEHNMGGREMMENYKSDIMAGNAPLVFARAKIAFHGLANELLKRKELTSKQRAAAEAARDAFA